MKKLWIAMGLVACASLCFAEGEEAMLQPLMKSAGATSGKMRKDGEAKANADVAADAKQLAGIFKQIGEVFTKRGGMDDAVKLASNGEMAANDLAAAAGAGDAVKMDASMKAVGAVCGSCHSAHREKGADGAFKIK
jgi:cytochrome c556